LFATFGLLILFFSILVYLTPPFIIFATRGLALPSAFLHPAVYLLGPSEEPRIFYGSFRLSAPPSVPQHGAVPLFLFLENPPFFRRRLIKVQKYLHHNGSIRPFRGPIPIRLAWLDRSSSFEMNPAVSSRVQPRHRLPAPSVGPYLKSRSPFPPN